MANIRSYMGISPQIDSSVLVDNSAIIIGKVIIGKNSSVWCNAVIRGDVNIISIGENTNIQDLTMLHVSHHNPGIQEGYPLTIGDNVTIGHNCCLHACNIKNNVLVGMGTTILDNATIQPNVIIGAGSLVASNKVLESGYLYFGNPLKQIRKLTEEEINYIKYSADHYVRLINEYKQF